jgi:hypothetical protein
VDPDGFVTVTLTVPLTFEVGALQVSEELEVTFTALQFKAPSVTVAPVTNPVPVSVSVAPASRDE